MAFVIGRLALAGGTEWLAGTGAGPNRFRPSGEVKGMVPSGDAGEEVDPLIASDVVRGNIGN
jgi:hypothetical protein